MEKFGLLKHWEIIVVDLWTVWSKDLFFRCSKLLQELDKASEDDPVGIEEAVLDKGQYTVNRRNVSFMAGFPFRRLATE